MTNDDNPYIVTANTMDHLLDEILFKQELDKQAVNNVAHKQLIGYP